MEKILAFVLVAVQSSFCGNVLYISPEPSHSHHIWNGVLALGLAEKGHNVTLAGPDADEMHRANYTHILLEGVYEDLPDHFDPFYMSNCNPIQLITAFKEYSIGICKSLLKSQGLQKLLNSTSDVKFDLIIFDVSIGSCLYPLIQKLNYPPTIAVTPFLLPPYVAYNFGNQLHPSHVPWYGLPYNSEISFLGRFWNLLANYGEVSFRNFKQYEVEHYEAKKVFGENIPSMEELERHISLVLTNTDLVSDYIQPLAPNFIAVGGLHTKESKQVSQDLKPVLDNAKNGIILFSFGTNIRSDKLNTRTQRALLDAFAQIPQTIIWKFESNIKNLPKNVFVKKFLPQNDILGHPNVKLFIGHGGALSTQEAIFHGVPILCVPFFMDQIRTARNIVDKKLGISLDYRRITSEYVLQKLNEILDNPLYSKNMKKVSKIFRDRKETPLETGIFWIEYTMRHRVTNFLSTPARDLPLYKSSGLDVILFLILVVGLGFFIFYKCVKAFL